MQIELCFDAKVGAAQAPEELLADAGSAIEDFFAILPPSSKVSRAALSRTMFLKA
jgi:hypothetical protein